MNVVLISTYELGRQPFGLASPAAWLRRAGASVTCMDLSQEPLQEKPIRSADLVAFYVPMHTATRLAAALVARVKGLNPEARLCFYGLYAPLNEPFLRRLGVHSLVGGEFEEGLVRLLQDGQGPRGPGRGSPSGRPLGDPGRGASSSKGVGEAAEGPLISLARQRFLVPDRTGLPPLSRYARLKLGDGRTRTAGYTEASRGCKHFCRHCPIVPVYKGAFRVVQRDVVLEDIRRQVAAGAQHITFGDPDFFNGPAHAIALVEALHEEHPDLTYDVTIKVEHLLKHSRHLPTLKETGCLFVTSAVESVDDRVLRILDKGHTREDFIAVVARFREVGLTLNPTFVTFTPWTTMEGYLDLLSLLAELDLTDRVSPVQLAIRLLIPAGSKLLELPEVQEIVGEFDEEALVHPWRHEDPSMDELHREVLELVRAGDARGESRRTVFSRVWERAHEAAGLPPWPLPEGDLGPSRAAVPYLNEPWYC